MIGPVQALVEQVQAFAEGRPDRDPLAHQRIAVLVPCYNEEAAIAKVVADFRAALPEADVYVYDNNSRDHTIEVARAAGAIVRSEGLQGKGRVVRRMSLWSTTSSWRSVAVCMNSTAAASLTWPSPK